MFGVYSSDHGAAGPRGALLTDRLRIFFGNRARLEFKTSLAGTDLKQVGGPRGKKLYVRVAVPELITLLSYRSRHSATATA
jgi:hypothetical protein